MTRKSSVFLLVTLAALAYISVVTSNDVYTYIYRECRGHWSAWSRWETCTKTCGGGTQSRHRTCVPVDKSLCRDTVLYMTPKCTGQASKTRKCNKHTCSASGGSTTHGVYKWTAWGGWSGCSVGCGGAGFRARERGCVKDPKAVYGPRNCQGNRVQKLACRTGCCPVDGNWQGWSAWSTCSASCGIGFKSRKRLCGTPTCGGRNRCVGTTTQKVVCNAGCCPVHAVWKGWSSWSGCSACCGGGKKYRTRVCTPGLCNGKKLCTGVSKQTASCSTYCCPVNGYWSAWTAWSTCTATCNGGFQTRARHCKAPTCRGRRICPGSSYQKNQCNTCIYYTQLRNIQTRKQKKMLPKIKRKVTKTQHLTFQSFLKLAYV
eukprot:m.277304 g.277304  ORF g.277304 m.277304 type:complete len:373 (+) comp40608_c0_seq23:3740-4858(+)